MTPARAIGDISKSIAAQNRALGSIKEQVQELASQRRAASFSESSPEEEPEPLFPENLLGDSAAAAACLGSTRRASG